MKKINCGGFYINEDNFEITDDGELKLKSGSGGSGGGGFFMVSIVPGSTPPTLTASYNDIKAAYDADKVVLLKSEGIDEGITWYAENLITSVASGEVEGTFKYMVKVGQSTYDATSPDAPLSIAGGEGPV